MSQSHDGLVCSPWWRSQGATETNATANCLSSFVFLSQNNLHQSCRNALHLGLVPVVLRLRRWPTHSLIPHSLNVLTGLTSHSTHNRSFRRRVFPGNQLHWYWQPKQSNTTLHTPETQKRNRKTALANNTIYTLILRLWSGMQVMLQIPYTAHIIRVFKSFISWRFLTELTATVWHIIIWSFRRQTAISSDCLCSRKLASCDLYLGLNFMALVLVMHLWPWFWSDGCGQCAQTWLKLFQNYFTGLSSINLLFASDHVCP